MEKISIIIPAYNEESRIERTLEEYFNFFNNKKKTKEIKDFEIIVVLNGCKDNTLEIVKRFSNKKKEILYLDFIQGGKGFAIMEGFRYSIKGDSEYIGFVDADMATPPHSFYDLVITLKDCDGAIASRGLKKSIVETSISRKITNRGFNFIVRAFLFLPYRDTQCGAKLFKRESLIKVIDSIGITKWAFDVDLLYKLKRKGFKIKEIPTVWYDRTGSKVEIGRVSSQMFLAIVRLRLLYSPFKRVVKIYDKISLNRKKQNEKA